MSEGGGLCAALHDGVRRRVVVVLDVLRQHDRRGLLQLEQDPVQRRVCAAGGERGSPWVSARAGLRACAGLDPAGDRVSVLCAVCVICVAVCERVCVGDTVSLVRAVCLTN